MTAQIIPFRTNRLQATPPQPYMTGFADQGAKSASPAIAGEVFHEAANDAATSRVAATEAISPQSTAYQLAGMFGAIKEAREASEDRVLQGDDGERPRAEELRKRYYRFFRECLQRGVAGRTAIEAMKLCRLNQGHIIAAFGDWGRYQAAIFGLSA